MGRPSKLSANTKRLIIREVTNGNLQTAVDVQRRLSNDFSAHVSVNRARQVLKEGGLTADHKKRRPKLTLEHRAKRMEFVRRYEHWAIDDWKRVVFSDGSKINRMGSDGVLWVWQNPRSGQQERLFSETPKHGGGSIMVWACMTWHGPGYMSKIDGGMDAKLYVDILDECLPLTQEWYGIDASEMIFQQDNDSKHTSNLAREYFEDHNYTALFWPPNSPDLNPIEHLWAYLKRQLAKYPRPPAGMPELWERVQVEWEEIPAQICQSLIERMPQRIQAVKKAKGYHTTY
jgi:hypothetical protein